MGKIIGFCDEHEGFMTAVTSIIGIFLFVWVVTFGVYKYDIEIAHANIVRVYIQSDNCSLEEQIIYEGKQAFIKIESGGMTTTVTIYKKLYPFEIVDRVYSDKTIRIESKMEKKTCPI